MKLKTKLLSALSIIGTLSAVTIFAFNMPTLIDKLNEERITYQIEQKSLQEINKTLRVEREVIDKKIIENSNKWNNLNGKIEQIDATIKMIELGK